MDQGIPTMGLICRQITEIKLYGPIIAGILVFPHIYMIMEILGITAAVFIVFGFTGENYLAAISGIILMVILSTVAIIKYSEQAPTKPLPSGK